MRNPCRFQLIMFIVAAVLLLGLAQTFVSAAPQSDKSDTNKKKEEIPPWMEKVGGGGGSTYLIPKGAKVEEVTAGFVTIEPPAEYVARQVFQLEKRQADMEKELAEMRNELKEMREQCALQQQSSGEKAP